MKAGLDFSALLSFIVNKILLIGKKIFDILNNSIFCL